MTYLIIGIFSHKSDASLTVRELKHRGIGAGRISVIARDKGVVDEISRSQGLSKPREATGGRGLFGTARGLAIALNLLPETSVAAGPAAAKLGGAEFGDDPAEDGIITGLVGIGIPRVDADAYAKHVEKDRIIVIAEVDREEAEEVTGLFERHQPVPLESVQGRESSRDTVPADA
ncbi:hypothetical protein KIH86_11990 [Paenibacillus sp. HN-1]|uniref:hypothetical protein n=1 Tax=Paenibacillus TaxID=44249 RepID=UPI001CAA0AEF|nr:MULTISPECIES: hypothetical protein [Paenibacillus]MBY9081423.1 hypothetical protein [Paenibacillus sp. CGMCC 1.18879]MBY9084943.1 hypothetical protein [Paenibacillus sinensis]